MSTAATLPSCPPGEYCRYATGYGPLLKVGAGDTHLRGVHKLDKAHPGQESLCVCKVRVRAWVCACVRVGARLSARECG